MAVAVSDKPWSQYSEADYTLEQWHAACLIHQHSGPPTSKSQCKLPVKTPTGTLNRNGVIAAAGALAGARAPLQASSEEKSKAAKALINYYRQLDMEPTPKMLELAHSDDVSDILAHYGIKGMRWGIRRENPSAVTVSTRTTPVGTLIKTKGGERLPAHPDAIAAAIVAQKLKKSGKASLSNEELQKYVNRVNLEQQASALRNKNLSPGQQFVKQTLTSIAKTQTTNLVNDIASKQVKALLAKK